MGCLIYCVLCSLVLNIFYLLNLSPYATQKWTTCWLLMRGTKCIALGNLHRNASNCSKRYSTPTTWSILRLTTLAYTSCPWTWAKRRWFAYISPPTPLKRSSVRFQLHWGYIRNLWWVACKKRKAPN